MDFGGVFAISQKKSRNLGILCACFEELPNLGGVCFMTFIHISNRWAIITILGHFGGVFFAISGIKITQPRSKKVPQTCPKVP